MRLLLCVVLALLLPATAAQAAGFTINRSMGGVRIGQSESSVRAALGKPAKKELGPDFVNWRYRRPAIEVTFKPRVITLFTRSPFVRGPQDVGVGTSEARLKRVVSGLDCSSAEGQRLCSVGSFDTGKRSTVFVLHRGQITSITISLSTP